MRGLLLVAGLALTVSPLAAQRNGSASWMSSPEVVEIRGIVQEVQRGIDSHAFVRRDSTICRNTDMETHFSYYVDSLGRIRRFVWKTASEDHGEENEYTYDSAGRLRFIFSSQAATTGSEGEIREYLAPRGRLIHQDVRTTKGAGYPWPSPNAILHPQETLKLPCED